MASTEPKFVQVSQEEFTAIIRQCQDVKWVDDPGARGGDAVINVYCVFRGRRSHLGIVVQAPFTSDFCRVNADILSVIKAERQLER